jgi:small conductance mechanosensitive channel
MDTITNTIGIYVATFGLKILGAIVVWIVGRWLIGTALRLTGTALTKQKTDPTLMRYLSSILNVVLNIILVIVILSYFGVETTSFAALIAAMGVAIGVAWAGLLSNFAAGVFMMILRPFKVGEYVAVAGLEGSVKEIGLFSSTLVAPDNSVVYVGNGKIFSDTIRNYSANNYRRVELTAQLAHGVDINKAITDLKAAMANIPNLAADQNTTIEILTFNERGTVLAVRPYTHTDHYWQVYFDTNTIIANTFASYPMARTQVNVQSNG